VAYILRNSCMLLYPSHLRYMVVSEPSCKIYIRNTYYLVYSHLEYSFPLTLSVAWDSYFSRCNNTWWNITAIYLWLIACLGMNARLSCYKTQHCGTSRPRPPSLPTITVHSHFIWYSWYNVVFCFLFIAYFTALLGSREYSVEGRVISEWWIGKNLEWSGRSLICALS
jgi:hypothetical protein